MKTKILTVLITMLMFGVLTATAQEDKKAREARKDIAEAQNDLKEAKIDSATNFHQFKKDAETNIHENSKLIAALKAKKLSDNKEINEKYNKKVAALEKKNQELKDQITKCCDPKISAWLSFKKEFNHDMEELGHAIKDSGMGNTSK